MKASYWVALAALSLLAAGCELYRVETVLYPDGSVDRAVYQPLDRTPAEVQKPGVWKQTTHALPPDKLQKEGWSGRIRDLAIQPAHKDRTYFAAWGHFPSVERIPEHTVFPAPEGLPLPSAKLAPSATRSDRVFVVEHRWSETLTDVVTPGDMRKAREELVELALSVAEDVFNEVVGDEYDGRELFKWLHKDGRAWFVEATEVILVQSIRRKPEAREEGLVELCARYGLNLKAQGKRLEGDDLDRATQEYIAELVCRRVHRKKDGKQLDRATFDAWFKEIENEDGKADKPTRWQVALTKVATAKHGGEKKLEEKAMLLVARLVGIHNMAFLSDDRMHCTLTMPGEVVETNGVILSGNRVRWEFATKDAWPLGYEMIGRSLDPNVQAQKELLKGQPLTGREEMVRYCELLEKDGTLEGALKACREKKSMTPLYDYSGNTAYRSEMLKLLKLPEK